MDTKLITGILMIVGTAIGAGMLALPLATAQEGFIASIGVLFICWFIMTSSALLILEVNMWFPPRSNIISMARNTLGKPGEVIAWVTYLVLLYALLSAYIAGGGDFLKSLMSMWGLQFSSTVSLLLFTFILGFIVYLGIRAVASVNRYLMLTKLTVFVLLVICILPFVSAQKQLGGDLRYFTTGVTVAITSFGFANIVPSLRIYFEDDVVKLRKAIIFGSLIPLVCYLVWNFSIMGVIPREGDNGLIAMLHSNKSTSDFVNTLSALLHSHAVTLMTHIFTAICLATSFLGVALSLTDFLADGLKIPKESRKGSIIYVATFAPPLAIVLFYPGAFVAALNYAGIDCMVLLVILPAIMAWRGRYGKLITQEGYQVSGGKPLLIILVIVAIFIIIQGIVSSLH